MSCELVIETFPGGVRAALLDGGRLVDLAFEDEAPGRMRDRIFLGRVRGVDAALDGAFIDCGGREDAFLGARDARLVGDAPRDLPLGRRLHAGQAVLVQGRRERRGGKGPRVTGDIALPGRLAVLRPRTDEVAISARLAGRTGAAAQRQRARRLFPAGGVSLRSAAAAAPDDALVAEVDRLRALWRGVEERAARATPPACVHDAGDPLRRILTALLGPEVERVTLGDMASLARARAWLEEHRPQPAPTLEHRPQAFASGAADQLEEALERRVPLAGGGALIIEATAALTAIDVDGGGRPPLETDLAAVPEIARQTRLRNLGGTVVVDFVDLDRRQDRARLLDELRRAFAHDSEPVRIWPMGPQGLVHLSRRRTGPTLAERLQRPCPVCAGEGRLPGLAARCAQLIRALGEAPARRQRARLAPDLMRFLEGEGAALWRASLEPGAPAPALTVDAGLEPGGYAIE